MDSDVHSWVIKWPSCLWRWRINGISTGCTVKDCAPGFT